jgi:hypothetical protein
LLRSATYRVLRDRALFDPLEQRAMVLVHLERAAGDVVVAEGTHGGLGELDTHGGEVGLGRPRIGERGLPCEPALARPRQLLMDLDRLTKRRRRADAERRERIAHHRVVAGGRDRVRGHRGAPGRARDVELGVACEHGDDERPAVEHRLGEHRAIIGHAIGARQRIGHRGMLADPRGLGATEQRSPTHRSNWQGRSHLLAPHPQEMDIATRTRGRSALSTASRARGQSSSEQRRASSELGGPRCARGRSRAVTGT